MKRRKKENILTNHRFFSFSFLGWNTKRKYHENKFHKIFIDQMLEIRLMKKFISMVSHSNDTEFLCESSVFESKT